MALLDGLGQSHRRIMPSELALETLPRYGGIILSGRKRNDGVVNRVNSKVVIHAIKYNVKLLGICYGAEIMALCLGGAIKRSDVPQKNVHAAVHVDVDTLLTSAGSILNVFESHGYEISRLPDGLEAVGGSEQCRYEIIKYRKGHIYGTQFHPEMSRDGRVLVERFCTVLS